jgi:hypothetical protein
VDAFSYLSVLLSIIVGLAITQVLQGYRALLLARERVRFDALPLTWSALTLLFATQSWWASFGLLHHDDWTFLSFSMVLLQTVLLYLLAAVTLPEGPGGETVDLRAHYARERRPFFLILIGLLAASLLKDLSLDGRLPSPENLAFHAFLAGTGLVGLLVRRRAVHVAVAVAGVAWAVIYIALLFARL